ncbi:MAG: hypothetical protein J6M92_11280, partial [Oribacterium sp.]|nr:hypothetical protein [Oribacterium sp.]
MKRNNPSSATSPNAPIDLTSLLDIVFIFLFVAIIGIKKNNQDIDTVTASMNSIIVEKDSENSTLMEENKALAIENEELKSLVDEYYESADERIEEDFKKEYSRLGEKVSIFTITCNYKNDYIDAEELRSNKMTLAVDGKIWENEDLNFQADLNMEDKMERVQTLIERYVDDNPDRIYIIEFEGRQTNNV